MKKPELKDFKLKESDFILLSEQEKRYEIAKAEHEKKVTILLCIGHLVVAIILGFVVQAVFNQSFWVGFGSFVFPGFLLFVFILDKISDFSGNENLYIDKELRERISNYNALQREYEEYVERQKSEFWINLSPYEFEKEVAEYFNNLGYLAKVTKGSGDGGVDIILYNNSKKIAVQCKHFKGHTVGPAPIRELYGVVKSQDYINGFFVSLDGYSYNAIEFAKQTGIKLFSLKDLTKNFDLEKINDNYEVEKNDTLIDNNFVNNTPSKDYEDLEQFNNKNILISTETTLKEFEEYLFNKGYKKYSNVGAPSTVIQYAQSIEKVANWEGISINEIIKNIDYYVKRYDTGGSCEKSGK